MSQKQKKEPKYNIYALEKALELVKNGSTVYSASKSCGIPISTLRKRVINNGKFLTRDEIRLIQSVLTKEEEIQLMKWVKDCADKGYPRILRQILNEAARIAKDNPVREYHFINDLPSRQWAIRFLKRCSSIYHAKPLRVDIESSITTEKVIKAHHKQMTKKLNDFGLTNVLNHPNRIGNADQTFLNFFPENHPMSTGQKTKSKNKKGIKEKTISIIFTILPTGYFLDSHLLYDRDRMAGDIIAGFPQGMKFGKAPNGLLTDHTFLEFLKNVIVPYLELYNVERPFILFVDGCSLHLSLEIFEFCTLQKIVLLSMYTNGTNIIQPLDTGVLTKIKSLWNSFLQQKYQEISFINTERTFALVFKEFMDTYAHQFSGLIQNAFKQCGIYPWKSKDINLENILEYSRKRKEEPHKDLEIEIARRYTFMNISAPKEPEYPIQHLEPHPKLELLPLAQKTSEPEFISVEPDIKENGKLIPKQEILEDVPINIEDEFPFSDFPNDDSTNEKKEWALKVLLDQCQSKELQNDLLNGTVDSTKDYGVDPFNILMNLVKSFKTETVNGQNTEMAYMDFDS